MPRPDAPAPCSAVAFVSASLRVVADHMITVYAVLPDGQAAKAPPLLGAGVADGVSPPALGVGVGSVPPSSPGTGVGAGVADVTGGVVGAGVGVVPAGGTAAVGTGVCAGAWATRSASSE